MDGGPLPPGVPTQCYFPVGLGPRSEKISVSESSILLANLGVSFYPHRERRLESYIQFNLAPPESIFLPAEPLSFPADIWSLACTLWSLVAETDIFDIWSDPTEEQVEALGKLPAEWWERWDLRSKNYDEKGMWENKGYSPRTWEDRYDDCIRQPREEAGMESPSDEEKEAFLALLKSMLRYHPHKRISAEGVLDSAWMRGWALPALGHVPKS
jgi:serine/threonine-protein kinase SRPK3